MKTLPDGWYLAIKGHSAIKGDVIVPLHVKDGNYGVIGRLASKKEFDDYRFVEFDLQASVEYAELLNELW